METQETFRKHMETQETPRKPWKPRKHQEIHGNQGNAWKPRKPSVLHANLPVFECMYCTDKAVANKIFNR
jgi:hypothetical protein